MIARLKRALGVANGDETPVSDAEDIFSDVEVPMGVALDLLSSKRRRDVIRVLADQDAGEGIDLGDLARQIAAIENEHADPSQVTSNERKRVYVGLYQTHVPKLADWDVLKHGDDGFLQSTPTTFAFAEALEIIETILGGEDA